MECEWHEGIGSGADIHNTTEMCTVRGADRIAGSRTAVEIGVIGGIRSAVCTAGIGGTERTGCDGDVEGVGELNR